VTVMSGDLLDRAGELGCHEARAPLRIADRTLDGADQGGDDEAPKAPRPWRSRHDIEMIIGGRGCVGERHRRRCISRSLR